MVGIVLQQVALREHVLQDSVWVGCPVESGVLGTSGAADLVALTNAYDNSQEYTIAVTSSG